MSNDRAGFDEGVTRCAKDLRPHLAKLADRYSPWVVLAALTEHVGSGLLVFQEEGTCTRTQAREMVARLQHRAFAQKPL